MHSIKNLSSKEKGIIITYVLVFGTVTLILLGGLLGFILFQLRLSSEKEAFNESLHIAEAGIDYYKWCLNNEVSGGCQLERDYFDASGNNVGSFSLQVNPVMACGEIIQREIISSGWTNKFENVARKVKASYARESVAKYSYVLNENVWVGPDHEIHGPYHSNGGVRFDGENQSLVTSARDEWVMTSSFGACQLSSGCRMEGSNCYCPGVFASTLNGNPDLFTYPIPPFNFTGITVDLAQIKSLSQASGIYLPPSQTINANGKGYRLRFFKNQVTGQSNIEVWIITSLNATNGYSVQDGWQDDRFTINGQSLYNTFVVQPGCSVIFAEDNIWPEGEVNGKITLASANLINPNLDTDAILAKNITYSTNNGSDGFALIVERNILIGPQSPTQMNLRGIFIAQKGRFSRNHYPNNFRDNLEIHGSIVSNGRVGTQWISGSQTVSGYVQRKSYFDSNLVYNPPPFVPYINPDFVLLNWEEVK